MTYLHKSKFQSHGHLCSANCYINNRWVLKIGGFGLDAFLEEDSVEMVVNSSNIDIFPIDFMKVQLSVGTSSLTLRIKLLTYVQLHRLFA
jgi:hypothetical protein